MQGRRIKCTYAYITTVLSRLSPDERAHVEAQLDELTATYNHLCDSSTQQLQQLEQQLASEEEKKVYFLSNVLRCEMSIFFASDDT